MHAMTLSVLQTASIIETVAVITSILPARLHRVYRVCHNYYKSLAAGTAFQRGIYTDCTLWSRWYQRRVETIHRNCAKHFSGSTSRMTRLRREIKEGQCKKSVSYSLESAGEGGFRGSGEQHSLGEGDLSRLVTGSKWRPADPWCPVASVLLILCSWLLCMAPCPPPATPSTGMPFSERNSSRSTYYQQRSEMSFSWLLGALSSSSEPYLTLLGRLDGCLRFTHTHTHARNRRLHGRSLSLCNGRRIRRRLGEEKRCHCYSRSRKFISTFGRVEVVELYRNNMFVQLERYWSFENWDICSVEVYTLYTCYL